MNKQAKFDMIYQIVRNKQKAERLANHIQLVIKQTIEAYDSIKIDERVNKKKDFSFYYWIFASILFGTLLGLIF